MKIPLMFFFCKLFTCFSRSWPDLFQPSNFFEEYSNYVMVVSSALGDAALWFGSVEAKLRQLNQHILTESHNKVVSARIWPQPFDKQEGNVQKQMWFFGIRMVVGQSPENIQNPLIYFSDLCMRDISKGRFIKKRTSCVMQNFSRRGLVIFWLLPWKTTTPMKASHPLVNNP